jgi:hypothetical protein
LPLVCVFFICNFQCAANVKLISSNFTFVRVIFCALGLNPDISQKYKMGDISKEVANQHTLVRHKNIQQKISAQNLLSNILHSVLILNTPRGPKIQTIIYTVLSIRNIEMTFPFLPETSSKEFCLT